MNSTLLAPNPKEDVHKAVFQTGPIKASDPDGMHVLYFSKILGCGG